ncbi:MAG TPA: SIS domain-containing protein [Kofleriaceae bacterium]|nr:SIS domain-containing protein [Kofleriaceae bacterium]
MIIPGALDAIDAALAEGISLRQRLREQGAAIAAAAGVVVDCLRAGGTLLLCGNGGSAADAQHIAAELTGRFRLASRPPLAALALTTDSSALTAIANDLGYARVFSRQVEALGRRGDALLAISTSGRSPSVVEAARAARERGVAVIALTGPVAGPLGELAEHVLSVPGESTDRIQELHITVGHILVDLVERALWP